MPVLIISHRSSGRVVRKPCATREQAWDLADRVLAGWLRKVHGSRYQEPGVRITGSAPGCRGRRAPLVFEVVCP
jgi:hypothetical protein